MRVLVGNKVFCSNTDGTIAVILSDNNKENIKNMDTTTGICLQAEDDQSRDEIEEVMNVAREHKYKNG